ncbi:protein phosphatase 2C domain-containing protein [Flavobacterium cheonanense]|uniref:Protein phosphatase 2C domain-containing protein n=1 Tax=Flavobacterium cheonanense TaxID=706183 RepID=A0ABP7VT51_9FLAO
MIYIKSEAYLTEKGQCDVNEDTIVFEKEALYLICDGVGGNGNGQVASKLVATTVNNFYKNNPNFELSNLEVTIADAIIQFKKKNPSMKLMASTIALTRLTTKSIQIAWIGDSLVYHIRNGHCNYKTKGHTWVNEAIDKGEITTLEQYFHPNKNQVTRIINGNQPPTPLDCHIVTDLQENDYFLLISDGVLEAFIEDDLMALFKSNDSCTEIITTINQQCAQFSIDNYSAILYQIGINEN